VKRRVVVTGLGAVTPLANNVSQTWSRLLQGESGIDFLQAFDVSKYTTRFGGAIKDFNPLSVLTAREIKYQDEFIQYGYVAAVEAVTDSGLDVAEINPLRCGVSIGSGIGGIGSIELAHNIVKEKGPKRMSPFFVPGSIINMVAGNVALRYGFKGPNIATATACTTGTHSIGLAARMIQYGDADVMVAGGAEKATTEVGLGGFCAARALSTRNDAPQQASRPWDQGRDGFVLSDGAGALVLEELEHARTRGATIYAELVGFGMSDDAHHITSPPADGEGAANAMKAALADAKLNADQIGYINAHGTSTLAGDLAECNAIKHVLGAHAYQVAVSSTKSMTGHLLGAAGAIEAIFSVLSIGNDVVPPTINLDEPAQGCDLNFVPKVAQEHKVDVVLSNSFGFGGTNGTLVFKKFN